VKQVDKAIFLHRINYSESSLIVTFYTYHNGIQKFIFQGGKKKSNSLFPLSLCEIEFYRRPDSELGKLTNARTYEMLYDISVNPFKSTIAFFLVDVLRQCLQTVQSDPELFSFLEQKILSLKTIEDLGLFVSRFMIEFSEQMGIEPHLQSEDKRFFHLQEGEFSDFDRNDELNAEGQSVLLIQQLLRKGDSIDFPSAIKRDAFEIMVKYYRLHIPGFDVQKSLDVIREILYN